VNDRPLPGEAIRGWPRLSNALDPERTAQVDPEPPFVEGDDISRPRSTGRPLSAWAKVREAAFAPAETITAELRTASAQDLAMMGVAGRQLRQALG
jgi:hypothetical protein